MAAEATQAAARDDPGDPNRLPEISEFQLDRVGPVLKQLCEAFQDAGIDSPERRQAEEAASGSVGGIQSSATSSMASNGELTSTMTQLSWYQKAMLEKANKRQQRSEDSKQDQEVERSQGAKRQRGTMSVSTTGDVGYDAASQPSQPVFGMIAAQREMTAESVREGKASRVLAREIVQEFDNSRLETTERTHTYASLCACTEVVSLALRDHEEMFQEEGVRHKFKCRYLCEIDERKWGWEQHVVEYLHGGSVPDDICLFKSMTELSKLKCKCQFHKHVGDGFCQVLAVEGIVGGLSCKDLARSNPNRWLLRGSLLHSSTSPGKTADCFWGLFRLLDMQGAYWIVLENSDLLLDELDSGAWDIVKAALEARSFRCRACLVDSAEFGLPQRRLRSYIVAVSMTSTALSMRASTFNQFQARFDSYLDKCRRKPPCLLDCVLPPSDARIDEEKKMCSDDAPHKLEAGTVSIHSKLFAKNNLRWGAEKVRDTTRSSPWFTSIPHRMKESLIFHQQINQKEVNIVGVDVSQSAGRSPQTSENDLVLDKDKGKGKFRRLLSPTIIPASFVWMMMPCPSAGSAGFGTDTHPNLQHERPLLRVEKLMLQGFPINDNVLELGKYWTLLNDMGGNMYSSTVILSVVASLIYAVDWVDEGDEADSHITVADDEDHVTAALAAMKRAKR